MKPDTLREYALVLDTLKPNSLLTVEATLNLVVVINKEFERVRHEILVAEFKASD